jgi:hypothetical protein
LRSITDQFYPEPITEGVIIYRIGEMVLTNVRHYCISHRPNGYEFGDAGSGPADLALNICETFLRRLGWAGPRQKCHKGTCFELAYQLHQTFKRRYIEGMKKGGGTLRYTELVRWFTGQMEEARRIDMETVDKQSDDDLIDRRDLLEGKGDYTGDY